MTKKSRFTLQILSFLEEKMIKIDESTLIKTCKIFLLESKHYKPYLELQNGNTEHFSRFD